MQEGLHKIANSIVVDITRIRRAVSIRQTNTTHVANAKCVVYKVYP